MIVITVARKPLEGTIAGNVVQWGTGGFNVAGCRIEAVTIPGGSLAQNTHLRSVRATPYLDATSWGVMRQREEMWDRPTKGRWPANLILQHSPTCRVTGTTETKGYAINRWVDGAKPFGGGAGHPFESQAVPGGESPVWECSEDCPIKHINQNVGVKTSGAVREGYAKHVPGFEGGWKQSQLTGFGDTGFVSRFFKQVKE